MSGHSKWSQIKHQKGQTDARRGQLFTKLARELTVAARMGGSNPSGNTRLRMAVQKARDSNMPTDNIERAIRRGAGGAGGQVQLEEITYEGFGPGGVAILVHVLTDNRNRTVSEVRGVLERGGGKLGAAGSVSWLFEQKGVIAIEEADPKKVEEMALLAIELEADDFKVDGDLLEVYSPLEKLETLRRSLEQHQVPISRAEQAMVPKSTVLLEAKAAAGTLRLLDRLEELDDVQKVYCNAEFPDEVLEQYRAAA
ncbi:MAG: YebC/PmpR family DNA-binding transcriptional regulator [Chloroflexi bacterium]|nr:YebC/PmpR family DNA-binding transcriptional regulator [Chloroflexota bacterium]